MKINTRGFNMNWLNDFFAGKPEDRANIKEDSIMTTTTFNPLVYFDRLKAAGVPEQQAHIQAATLNEILEGDIATKKDLIILEGRLGYKLKELENKLIIWIAGMMAGSFVATVATLAFLMDWMVKGISFSH